MAEKYEYEYQFVSVRPDSKTDESTNNTDVLGWQVVRKYMRKNTFSSVAEEYDYLPGIFTELEKNCMVALARRYDDWSYQQITTKNQMIEKQPVNNPEKPKKVVVQRVEQVFANELSPEMGLWKIARCVGYWDDGVFRQTSKTLSEAAYWADEVESILWLALRYEIYTDLLTKGSPSSRLMD